MLTPDDLNSLIHEYCGKDRGDGPRRSLVLVLCDSGKWFVNENKVAMLHDTPSEAIRYALEEQ